MAINIVLNGLITDIDTPVDVNVTMRNFMVSTTGVVKMYAGEGVGHQSLKCYGCSLIGNSIYLSVVDDIEIKDVVMKALSIVEEVFD